MSITAYHPNYLVLEHDGDVTITRFRLPQLTEEDNIDQMGQELFALPEQYGRRKVILSLTNVSHLTSAAIGKIITMHRRMHRLQGRLLICDLPPGVREVMRISRLLDYFQVFEDVPQALQALNRE